MTSPIDNQHSADHSTIKKWIIISTFIIALSGIFYVSYHQYNIYKSNTPNTEVVWKTYRNESLGLEFSYPEYWGLPYTSPENITNLNTLDKSIKYISIYFTKNNKINITIFGNVMSGTTFFPWSLDSSDNLESLIQSGNICDYKIFSNKNVTGISDTTELNTTCKKDIKKSFIEKKQNFSDSSNPEILYSYEYADFAYLKNKNDIFKNMLIKYTISYVPQQKNQLTYENFINQTKPRPNDDEFINFQKSIKTFETIEHNIPEVEFLSSDTENIKLVKSYYNSLIKKDYESAFSLFSDESSLQSDSDINPKNIYNIKIKEINQLDSNQIEVFLDVQLQNKPNKTYRQIWEVKNGKIKKIIQEVIQGDISKFNNMKIYGSIRNNKSLLILQVDGIEKIIDSREYDKDELKNTIFYFPIFSPKGNYVFANLLFYEDTTSNIYDIKNNKIFFDIPEGKFNAEETQYITCNSGEPYNDSQTLIYNVPQFTVREDLLKTYPEIDELYYKTPNYKCYFDEKLNLAVFEFNGIYEKNNYNPDFNKIFKFNLDTSEWINI